MLCKSNWWWSITCSLHTQNPQITCVCMVVKTILPLLLKYFLWWYLNIISHTFIRLTEPSIFGLDILTFFYVYISLIFYYYCNHMSICSNMLSYLYVYDFLNFFMHNFISFIILYIFYLIFSIFISTPHDLFCLKKNLLSVLYERFMILSMKHMTFLWNRLLFVCLLSNMISLNG